MKMKILIVDDIELNRAILKELFAERYEFLEAANGLEALEILGQYGEDIGIVLLDIIMPVMDGFGVLDEMTRRGFMGRIPVIMITSETSEEVIARGYGLLVADIISKPFSPNIVRQRVQNVVEQYSYRLHLEKMLEQKTEALRAQTKFLHENSSKMIDMLSAIVEFKNTESVSHIQNIRVITRLLLQELARIDKGYHLTEDLIEVLAEAAAMHDIGKIAIPDHILNKPGKLSTEEFEVMKTHSARGCEILDKLTNLQSTDYHDYCYEICRHHHERWDGRGYPDALLGDETPIWAQVVSLADVYDALTSKRVYKEAFAHEVALSMIATGACGVFNPKLLECFLNIAPQLETEVLRQKQQLHRVH